MKEVDSAHPKKRPPSSDRTDTVSRSASFSSENMKISDGGTENQNENNNNAAAEISGKKSTVFQSMRSNSIKESKQFRSSLTGSLLKIGNGYFIHKLIDLIKLFIILLRFFLINICKCKKKKNKDFSES